MTKRIVRPVLKPWTKEDVRELKAHSKATTPVVKVSKVMKRRSARCAGEREYSASGLVIDAKVLGFPRVDTLPSPTV